VTIPVEVARSSHVRLAVYDISGRERTTIADGVVPAGRRDFVWDGTDASGRRLPSGVYLLRLETGGDGDTQKIVLLR
jgi:flagellar hook assembly protein FlgD